MVPRSRLVAPLVVLVALVVVTAATESWRRARPSPPAASADSLKPYPIEPFAATDLDGRDVGTSTWAGRVVVVNFWATWCAPCRREIPALSSLQDSYADRVLVLGVLDDNVTDDFARRFATSVGHRYPIVRTSFDVESRFPYIAVLPMTFIVDQQGRLVHMYAGEIDPPRVERVIRRLLGDT
jgi:cytochrome c biogenesis protein CcmG/thiol:disulfide interchange protein DsbE